MITNEQLNEVLGEMGKASSDGKSRIVELDDTIKFNCKRCGQCCSNRGDIILNPFDVYRIAKAMNITTYEAILEYCTIRCGINSCLPIVTLKEDERGLCPFLKFSTSEGKFGCSINNSKPGACIMHPIGVVRTVDKTKNETDKQFIEVPSCNIHGTDVEVKVRDFIKPYLDNEECHENGSLLLFEPTKYIDTKKFIKGFVERDEDFLQKNFSQEDIEKIKSLSSFIIDSSYSVYMNTTATALYDIDTNKGFMEQVDDIKANVKKSCFTMIPTFAILGLDFSTGELKKEDMKEIDKIAEELKEKFDKIYKDLDEEM
jgi:Fe-S-cluster containining protein